MVDGGDHEAGARPLIGYAVSVAIVLIAVVAFAVLLATADFDGDATGGGEGTGLVSRDGAGDDGAGGQGAGAPDLLPEGGAFATPGEDVGLKEAAKTAGCELESYPVKSRLHIKSLDEPVRYSSNPPTSGRHYVTPAADAAYVDSPDPRVLVHTLEHGRVIVWFKRDLSAKARASLKAFYDSDSFLMLLVPDTLDMPYEVAASAWSRDPLPDGTGRLLGCPKYGDAIFTALERFKEEHRGKGPERVR